jgi:hypothetical protein
LHIRRRIGRVWLIWGVQELDDAPPSSQPRPESESGSASEDDIEQDEPERKVNGGSKARIQHREVIEISSDEESESDSGAEEEEKHENESGVEEGRGQDDESASAEEDEQDNQSVAGEKDQPASDSEVESDVDEFEGFDVNPEDKEFFQKLLDIAPPDAIMELSKARGTTTQPPTTTAPVPRPDLSRMFPEVQSISALAPDVQRAKRVKIFAEDHPFRARDRWTEDDVQEYKDDVFGFAKAAGFSDVHAELEVGKAMGAWKIERGMPLPLPEDTRFVETQTNENESVEEYKRRRKAAKKERRRLARLGKQNSRNTSVVSENTSQSSQFHVKLEHPTFQSAESYYANTSGTGQARKNSRDSDMSLSRADEKSIGLALKKKKKAEKKRLKKLAKLGPKKSEYFPKSTSTSSAVPTLPPRTDDAELSKTLLAYQERRRLKEEKKRARAAREVPDSQPLAPKIKVVELPKHSLALLEKRQLANAKEQSKAAHPGKGRLPDQLQRMALQAKYAVMKAPLLVMEGATQNRGLQASYKATTEPEQIVKKNKTGKIRSRKRNKNRLADEASGDHEAPGGTQTQDETTKLQPLKSTVAEDADQGQGAELTFPKKSIGKHQNGEDLSRAQEMPSPVVPDVDDSGRPTKRRNREGKSNTGNQDLEMTESSRPFVAETAIPTSDHLLESIETNDPSSKKKRKRSKSKAGEDLFNPTEEGKAAAVDPLTERADTNSSKQQERRLEHAKKRARSADATEIEARPSNQSSKVHHSQ